jgi:N-acetyltransferase
VIALSPVTLEGHGVRLEPLTLAHEAGLRAAAADGALHELWYTSVPAPDQVPQYITTANEGMAAGHMLPWAVHDVASGDVIGSTRYHDIVPAVDRVEIGYTFYAQRWQRSHVNTACKLLLLTHAFETVGCEVVGLRTDNFNFRSQRAIEGIGAKRDGIIRHHHPRRDGTVRDTYVYSILRREWMDVKRHLTTRLTRNSGDRGEAAKGTAERQV